MGVIYTNNAVATVTNGGTTAPASGHAESWTVTTTTYPSALTGGDYFHVADPNLTSEKVRITGISGSGPYVWSVTRGDEGTTPVAHSAGFTVNEVATSSDLMQGSDDWYNVKSPIYGATGNGTTDDTAAIKAAVAAAVAAGNGGTIYFPAGTYKVSSTISCGGTYPNGGLCFRGAGYSSEIFLANASNCYIFDFGSGGNPVFTLGAHFADLYLNCNGANQSTAGGGIYARGAVWCYFEHLWIETPWEAGIRFYQDGASNYGHHNTIHGCLFRDGKNAAGTGQGWAVKLEQCDENTLSGNTFQDNCHAQSAGHDAQVYDTSAGLQSIIGNHFVGGGTGSMMIKSDSSPSRCTIVGNQFDGPNAANCIEVDGASAVIADNEFLFIGQNQSSGTVSGVTLGGAQGNKVLNNSFYTSNSTHAVAITEQSGSGPNIITGNEINGTFNSYIVSNPTGGSYISRNIISAAIAVGNDGPINAVYYGADPTGANDSTTAINNAIAAIPANGGTVYLPAGTYLISSTITLATNQHLVGAGVNATIITSSSNILMIRMGNVQSSHVMDNGMYLGDLSVNATGTQTHTNVLIDGGGYGTSIRNVSTGGGKYGFELMDLDRCYFENLEANNPTTAGIVLEVGYENTYGTVTFVNCFVALSNNSTYGFYVIANADQSGPNIPDRLVFEGCMMFMTGGLTGCVGFYDTLGMTSTSFVGCLWEQNNRQFRTDGSGSTVNFQGCTFLDSNNVCTDIAYLNGTGKFTFRDCRFQQATNAFNGVSNSPSVALEGKNNNQGNITNLFTGTFNSKMGTDTVFAGDNILALGLNNQRFGFGFINQLVGNPVAIYPSSDGAAEINFYKANGSTVVAQFNTSTSVFTRNGGTNTAGSTAVLTPTFSNGSATQLSDTTKDYMIYFQIGTAGTGFSLAIGPTSTPANTIMASATPTADEFIAFRLPAGWYVKWAGTSTTLTTQTAISC